MRILRYLRTTRLIIQMFFDIVGKSVPISQIRLQGKWLQECDFEPGSHVQIQYECDNLVITKES